MSGDFWGSQEGCQGPFRPSGRNRALPLRRRRGQGYDKGHEERGSAYAKAGLSLRSPPGNSRSMQSTGSQAGRLQELLHVDPAVVVLTCQLVAPPQTCTVQGVPNSRPAGPPAESNLPHLRRQLTLVAFYFSTIMELDPVIRPKINIEPLFPEAYCFHGFGACFVLFSVSFC